jgi:hypothetical protein
MYMYMYIVWGVSVGGSSSAHAEKQRQAKGIKRPRASQTSCPGYLWHQGLYICVCERECVCIGRGGLGSGGQGGDDTLWRGVGSLCVCVWKEEAF